MNEDVVSALLKNQQKFLDENKSRKIVDEPYGLKCRCGGDLTNLSGPNPLDIAKLVSGRPRYSKKSRLRKKFSKKWREKYESCLFITSIATLMRHPMGFVCLKCGQNVGFYSAIATNILKVEPMSTPSGQIFYVEKDK